MNFVDKIRLLNEAFGCDRAREVVDRWKGRLMTTATASEMAAELRHAVIDYYGSRGDAALGCELAKHVAIARAMNVPPGHPPKFAVAAAWIFTEAGDTICGEWERLDAPPKEERHGR